MPSQGSFADNEAGGLQSLQSLFINAPSSSESIQFLSKLTQDSMDAAMEYVLTGNMKMPPIYRMLITTQGRIFSPKINKYEYATLPGAEARRGKMLSLSAHMAGKMCAPSVI